MTKPDRSSVSRYLRAAGKSLVMRAPLPQAVPGITHEGIPDQYNRRKPKRGSAFVRAQLPPSPLRILKLRPDWVGVRFNPGVVVTCFVAYRNDESEPALIEFADFIAKRFAASLAKDGQAPPLARQQRNCEAAKE